MKKHLCKMMMICLFVFTTSVHAGDTPSNWITSIVATGQDMGSVDTYEVTIGVGFAAEKLPAPPAPPEYSVLMELVDPEGPILTKDIRETGQSRYMWIVSINPSGNNGSFNELRSSTLTWEASSLGEGEFSIREGYDGKGRVVVDDMKSVNVLLVEGTGITYFTIEYIP